MNSLILIYFSKLIYVYHIGGREETNLKLTVANSV